jgi:hypothetical protein
MGKRFSRRAKNGLFKTAFFVACGVMMFKCPVPVVEDIHRVGGCVVLAIIYHYS